MVNISIYNIINIINILICFDFILNIESSNSNKFHHPLSLNKKYEDNYIQHQIQINDLSNLLKVRLNTINNNNISSSSSSESNNHLNNTSKIVLKRNPGQSHCPRSHDYKDGCLQIDFSQFNKILSLESVEYSKIPNSWFRYINTKNDCFVANVQALVNMEDFVDNLLPYGYIPAVVPEFKGITVGGSIQGLAAESTSFKCGLFHDVVLEFEAILSNGTILTCNRSMNSDLFYSLPGSFGSLAICTSAKVLCIPASPFVQIKTKSHSSHKECIAYMMDYVYQSAQEKNMMFDEDVEEISSSKNNSCIDFLEGIGFNEQQFVSIEGTFFPIIHSTTSSNNSSSSDNNISSSSTILRSIGMNNAEIKPPLLRCTGWGTPWFFNIIRHRANNKNKNNNNNSLPQQNHYDSVFLLPTKDYLFRHDRGSFWMASYRIPQIIGRFLDPLLDSSNMFKLATALPWAFPKHTIVLQDFMLPAYKVDSFIQQMQEELQVWPIWLLPMYNTYRNEDNVQRRSYHTNETLVNPNVNEPMIINPTIDYNSTTSNRNTSSSASKYPIFSVAEENLVNGNHFCNVGAYGIPALKYNFIPSNQKLENLLYLHEGRKVYYSHAFYDKSFFYHNLYNGKRYFDMRKKYAADGFHEIYDKIVTKSGKL